MVYNILDDINMITSVDMSSLNKLVKISNYCICDYVDNLSLNDTDIVNIDIGIGVITILYVNDELKYSFKPSKELEKNLVKTIIEGENPLIANACNTLKDKIINAYKDII